MDSMDSHLRVGRAVDISDPTQALVLARLARSKNDIERPHARHRDHQNVGQRQDADVVERTPVTPSH